VSEISARRGGVGGGDQWQAVVASGDRVVGGVLSAFPVQMLPIGEERQHFRDGLRDAVGDGPFPETVDVGLLFGVRE
jgi:hypothetical protein